jgi:hypothetical protein
MSRSAPPQFVSPSDCPPFGGQDDVFPLGKGPTQPGSAATVISLELFHIMSMLIFLLTKGQRWFIL